MLARAQGDQVVLLYAQARHARAAIAVDGSKEAMAALAIAWGMTVGGVGELCRIAEGYTDDDIALFRRIRRADGMPLHATFLVYGLRVRDAAYRNAMFVTAARDALTTCVFNDWVSRVNRELREGGDPEPDPDAAAAVTTGVLRAFQERLSRLMAFADETIRVQWAEAVRQPLSDATRCQAGEYLDDLELRLVELKQRIDEARSRLQTGPSLNGAASAGASYTLSMRKKRGGSVVHDVD